jgi:16S rRNA (guanine527-N7)-methyltransferase
MTASGATPPPAYGRAEFASEFGVSRETLDRMQTYASLLAQWQKAINLVSPSTLSDVWRRHFADSAQLVRLAPPSARTWIDLGSGAGFPGLVVAILLAEREPRPRLTLIESDQRKCAFLREVARQTGVTVDILTTRIENAATQFNLQQGEIVSARALASLTDLLRLASPYLSDRSVGLFLKGREAEAEVTAALESWRFEAELVPSVTDASARVVVVRRFAGARVAPKPKG